MMTAQSEGLVRSSANLAIGWMEAQACKHSQRSGLGVHTHTHTHAWTNAAPQCLTNYGTRVHTPSIHSESEREREKLGLGQHLILFFSAPPYFRDGPVSSMSSRGSLPVMMVMKKRDGKTQNVRNLTTGPAAPQWPLIMHIHAGIQAERTILLSRWSGCNKINDSWVDYITANNNNNNNAFAIKSNHAVNFRPFQSIRTLWGGICQTPCWGNSPQLSALY